ncbi:serine/threonine-protein kinase [Cryptosporangium aurantiacum]|uniref:Serine/threonine protein kinase n=1 Tax=Cryptosporangium aurantiacum TaxID=134849 RepID=A0A1M7R342_9ACTN|nr:serine/threonine-protein kinase [Cryptosporangium aurantiacum]SHN39221.1 Serine/threonine protein kinase [Cryptosporangium aurantiacum]
MDDGEWAAGDTIAGRYRVVAISGRGGMGLVYRVHHLEWGVDLAMKSPQPRLFGTPEDRERFVVEAETWVSLGLHPNVCACHYVRTIDGIPRIFAEYLPGGSLREWIDDRRLYRGDERTNLATMLRIAVQFAWGLHHAHEHGLVHQDVKPANVLMDDESTAKITDFGLAKARATARGSRPLRSDGTDTSVLVSGRGYTPAYASPEQMERRPLGRRSDLWNYAASVLEMFTGGVSWSVGPAAGAALAQYRHSGPPRPDLPSMPEPVADVLDRCLRPDPAERPANLTEVADVLIAALERTTGRPSSRTPPPAAVLRADGLVNRAVSLFDLERPQQAEQTLSEALSVDPHNPHALYSTGLLRWRRGEISDTDLLDSLEHTRPGVADPTAVDALLVPVQLERGALVGHGEGTRPPDLDGEFDGELDHSRLIRLVGSGPLALVGPAVHPDGRKNRLDREDETFQVRDLRTGTVTATLVGHTGAVWEMDATPDGRCAVSLGLDEQIRVWDLPAGECRHVLPGGSTYQPIRISADGRRIVFQGNDGVLRIWDAASGHLVARFESGWEHEAYTDNLAVSADGRVVLSAAVAFRSSTDRAAPWVEFPGGVRLWDTVAGRELPGAPLEHVHSVAVSADGRVAACYDNISQSIRAWRFDGEPSLAGEPSLVLRTPTSDPQGAVGHVALSADGRLLASGTELGTVRLWETATGRCLRTCVPQPSPDRTTFMAPRWVLRFGADDRQVVYTDVWHHRFWAVPTGYVAPWLPSRPRSHALLLAAAERAHDLLTEAGRAFTEERMADSLALLSRARSEPGHERDARLLHAWRRLAERSVRTGVRAIWALPPLVGHEGRVNRLAVGPDPRWAVTGGADGTVRRWDVERGELAARLETGGPVPAVAMGQGSDVYFLRAAGPDGSPGEQQLQRWRSNNVTGLMRKVDRCLEVSPDGRVAVMMDRGGVHTAVLLEKPALLANLASDSEPSQPVRIPLDARISLSLYLGQLRIHHNETGARLGEHSVGVGMALAVAPDSDHVLTMYGGENALRLWRLTDNATVHLLRSEDDGRIQGAVFAPDGRFALSWSRNSIRAWNLESGTCLRTLHVAPRSLTNAVISADSRFILAGTTDGSVLRWEVDWALEARAPANWDDGVVGILTGLIGAGAVSGVPLTYPEMLRWIRRAGYGWVRPAAIFSWFDEHWAKTLEGTSSTAPRGIPSGS